MSDKEKVQLEPHFEPKTKQPAKKKNVSEFAGGVLLMILAVMGVAAFVAYKVLFYSPAEAHADRAAASIATVGPLDIPTITPPPTDTPPPPLPTPTPALIVSFSSPCSAYQIPLLSSVAAGQYLPEMSAIARGRWADWVLLENQMWVQAACLAHYDFLPEISPPMLPAFTPTPTAAPATATPAPTAAAVVVQIGGDQSGIVGGGVGYIPPQREIPGLDTPTPTPTPLFQFRPLPDGFTPSGWCAKIAAAAVIGPDNNRWSAGGDGYVYLSPEALHLPVVVERSGWYEDFVFTQCGEYK